MVVAIIGILATIVVVALVPARRRSRDAKRISDVRQLSLALQLYREDNSQYPADIYATSSPAFFPDYLRIVPTDPNTAANYSYGVDSASNPQDYVLGAVLESSNTALNADVDGTVFSVSCADPTYCTQPL